MNYDYVIVGAGFSGSVCAERLAARGASVLLIDRRPHVGGNAFDRYDDHGVLIHPYGPHIFHTNARRVFDYLSNFTAWRFYEHRVLAEVEGVLYPFPINRTTLNRLYGLSLDEAGAKAFFERVRLEKTPARTSEDVVLASVGPDLCETFFRGYTWKQWGLDLSELAAGVAARIPTRINDDDRYFTDAYQFMPRDGYHQLFENMLDNENIQIELGVGYDEIRDKISCDHTIYTGPIDEYFSLCLGKLPYRSLVFEHEFIDDVQFYQSASQINYPNDHNYTRVTEFKHMTGQSHRGSSIVREYPTNLGEPYYPVPRPENEALYRKYRDLADALENVSFVGRLAQYRYYNMDQAVAAALALIDTIPMRQDGMRR